jgi:hypothetical protein
MSDPAEPTPQTLGAGLAPMMLEVHAMAKMRVQKAPKNEIALERLNEIEFGAATEPVEQITEGAMK